MFLKKIPLKNLFFFLFLLFSSAFVFGQPAPKPFGVVPTAAQLKWHEMEMYCMVSYGVNTYNDREWGFGDEDPALVNPPGFNAEEVVSSAKAGGFKGVILVAKHHDGLCLWPTKTTSHNISQSPWKNGSGDMVKDYQLACKKLGMKFGIYCSPWDRNNSGYGTPVYVKTYREQLKELYSDYGPLFIAWHDGADGGDGYYGGTREKRTIDRSTYYGWDTTFALTRRMQPAAVIFGDIGPDIRWVGNEEGYADETSWATYTPEAREAGKKPANGASKYWLGTTGTKNGEFWMPAECDVPLRPGWFYHASQDDQVKTPYNLLDLYYKSVGRGANLDIGLAPDRSGKLHPNDVRSLQEFGVLLKTIFSTNLAKAATITASNIRGKNSNLFGTKNLTDDDRYSYWATDDDVFNPVLTINLKKQVTFNVIRLKENIKLGQRITSFVIDAFENQSWKEIASATSIGSNRLIRLQQNVTTEKLRLRITSADACIALSDFGLFREPPHPTPPIILRDKSGVVQIRTTVPVSKIHYTTDGSEPGLQSPEFNKPFLFPEGGIVKAKCFESDGSSGKTVVKHFGLLKTGWKISSSLHEADKLIAAIDEDPGTFFKVNTRELIIDMGKLQSIKSFSYLPRQDKKPEGIVDKYSISVSDNGVDWKQVATGEFSNIRANPIEQVVLLAEPVTARYFKFSALQTIAGEEMSVAELGVSLQ